MKENLYRYLIDNDEKPCGSAEQFRVLPIPYLVLVLDPSSCRARILRQHVHPQVAAVHGNSQLYLHSFPAFRSFLLNQPRTMMTSTFLFRRPLSTPISIGLGITTAFATHSLYRSRPLLCDASPTARNISENFRLYSEEAKVPVFRNGRPNPAAYKQLSAGSICGMAYIRNPFYCHNHKRAKDVLSLLRAYHAIGLLGGLAVSTFSKTLAFLLGLAVWGVQVRKDNLSIAFEDVKASKC